MSRPSVLSFRVLGIVLLGLLPLLSACGFQLRGAQALPFTSLYVPGETWEVGALLRRNIRAMEHTQIVDTPQEAQAVFHLLGEAREKEILSLAATGRVREYRLRYRLAFKVSNPKGQDYLEPTEISLVRDISFSDDRVLAKEQEETLLYRDMENDMVQQVLRRLAALRVAD